MAGLGSQRHQVIAEGRRENDEGGQHDGATALQTPRQVLILPSQPSPRLCRGMLLCLPYMVCACDCDLPLRRHEMVLCRMRSALITGFWATSTIAVSSISYVATRMSGNVSDTMQEHSIASILSVSFSCPTYCCTHASC